MDSPGPRAPRPPLRYDVFGAFGTALRGQVLRFPVKLSKNDAEKSKRIEVAALADALDVGRGDARVLSRHTLIPVF